jgi:tetratricopeptide (TPR) repeat protein
MVLREENKFAEAEQTIREELAIDLTLCGEEHPYTANTYATLGGIIADAAAGRLEEAETNLRKALQIQKRTEGEGRLSQYYSHKDLANVLERQGRLAEAECHCRDALAIARRQMGPDNPDLAAPLAALAQILRKQGKTTEARRLADEAVDICKRLPGRVDHWMQDRAFATLREILSDAGDSAAIEALDTKIKSCQSGTRTAPGSYQ